MLLITLPASIMGYPIEECVWPESHVPEEVKTLLDLFFRLADTKADDSGRRMAEEVFTPEGIIQTSQRFQGSQREMIQTTYSTLGA